MHASEGVGRAGEQPDASAKTREAKLVTVWTAKSRAEEGKPVRDPGSITYSAAIESAATADTCSELSDFAARVESLHVVFGDVPIPAPTFADAPASPPKILRLAKRL
jgi:hypothetical protein